jgi:REP element-mobilizing transposase RayT
MTRPLRLEFPGALYHVTSRGNARASIYADDADRESFLTLLTQVVQRYHWLWHAYCLMDNHYHLLLETPEGNFSHGMRQANGLYTQYYNRRHDHVGHVFQGRYKAILVERDSYLLVLCRYIVLNPIRAGMVRTAQEYRWSSYRATAGCCEGGALLCTDWLLAQFGGERAEAQLRYRRFVDEGRTSPSPWAHLQGQILLGPRAFVEGLRPQLTATRRLHEVPRVQRYADRPALATLFHDSQGLSKAARDRLIYTAHVDYGYSLSAIGRVLGLHYTTISKVVKAQMM